MRYLLVLLLLTSPTAAQVSPEASAQLHQMIGNLVMTNISLADQLKQAQAKIDKLDKELAAEKAKK